MKEQNGLLSAEQNRLNVEETDAAEEPSRAEEKGTLAEPDAPTAVEENTGMSTVLDAEPLTGVQDDLGDQ